MRRDFNEHHMTQVTITENQRGTMQTMEEVSEHVGINYPDNPDSRYSAHLVDDFLFPWEEGSVENPITIEEDERFSEPRNPVSEPPRQPPAMEARFCILKTIVTRFMIFFALILIIKKKHFLHAFCS